MEHLNKKEKEEEVSLDAQGIASELIRIFAHMQGNYNEDDIEAAEKQKLGKTLTDLEREGYKIKTMIKDNNGEAWCIYGKLKDMGFELTQQQEPGLSPISYRFIDNLPKSINSRQRFISRLKKQELHDAVCKVQELQQEHRYMEAENLFNQTLSGLQKLANYLSSEEDNNQINLDLAMLYYFGAQSQWHQDPVKNPIAYGPTAQPPITDHIRLALKRFQYVMDRLEIVPYDKVRFGTLGAIGRCLMRFGRYEEAAQYFKMLIKEFPNEPVGYDDLASIEYWSGRYNSSISILKEALVKIKDLQPEEEQMLRGNVLLCLIHQRRWSDAIEWFRSATKLGHNLYPTINDSDLDYLRTDPEFLSFRKNC